MYIWFQSGENETPFGALLRRLLCVKGAPELSNVLVELNGREEERRLERLSCHSFVGTTDSPRSGYLIREIICDLEQLNN